MADACHLFKQAKSGDQQARARLQQLRSDVLKQKMTERSQCDTFVHKWSSSVGLSVAEATELIHSVSDGCQEAKARFEALRKGVKTPPTSPSSLNRTTPKAHGSTLVITSSLTDGLTGAAGIFMDSKRKAADDMEMEIQVELDSERPVKRQLRGVGPSGFSFDQSRSNPVCETEV